jgi:tetratricopeptide (TPR) repeat protein
MSQPPDSDLWSPTLARHVDAVCDRFEAAHQAGQRPRVADYLDEAPGEEHPVLLRELLALDLAYRSRGGETPAPEEYVGRFPDHAALIRDVFREAVGAAPTPPVVETPDAGRPYDPTSTTQPEFPQRPAAAGPGPTAPDLPGYEILGVLGEGGMGVVYKAVHLPLKRVVALKLIRAGAHAGPEQISRFRLEAEAVARLQHPHIVQVYEIGEHAGLPYLALEYVEGGSLAQRLRGVPQPAGPAAELVETLARAVHFAHQKGVVHRDLKPANVLLAACGLAAGAKPQAACVPKITDFGLAKRLDADVGGTHSGAVVGTPMYMAPEQAEARNREVGPAADVYALGAILYEVLTGRPPFLGENPFHTLAQVCTHDPVSPRRLQPTVPRDLEKICLKCLEKDPTKRYASAGDLADDLRRFRNGEPVRARLITPLGRALKWARRRKVVAALVAVTALAGLGLVVGGAAFLEQRARFAEQEFSKLRHLDDLRIQAQGFIRKGREAADARHWEEAVREFGKALTIIRAEPLLADVKAEVEREAQEAERQAQEAEKQRASQQARALAVEKRDQFNRWRNDAVFHGIVLTGLDLPTSLKATRDAADQALALFGMSAGSDAGPVFAEPFTAEEQRDIAAGCYELLLLRAEAEAQQGTPEHVRGAVALLEQAARLGLRTRAYHLRRARYLALLGEQAAAGQELDRAQALQPADALDDFLMGDDEQRRGGPENLRAAVRHFESAVGRQPGHFWAHYSQAVCYLKLQRPDLAEGPLTACLVLQPRDFPWVYLLRGFAHGQLREFEAADADFQKAQQVLERNPNEDARYSVAVNRGVLRLRQAISLEAVMNLQHAGPLIPLPGQLLGSLARVECERHLRQAETDLREAVGLKPNQYQAYLDLAEVYQQQRRPDRAAEEFRRAVAACQAGRAGAPALQLVYRARARFHREANDAEAALSDLRRAIALEPPGSQAPELAQDHLECGRIWLRLKRHAEALTAFEAALAVRPDLTDAYRGRGEALLALERSPEAVRAFDEYLLRVGKGKASPEAYRLRGMARAWLLDYAGALDDYTRALEFRRDAPTLVLRGWAYLLQESPALALHDFQEAIDLDPANGDAYSGRGYAHVRLGQYRPAVRDAEKALACGAENSPRLLCNAARVFAQAVGRIDGERDRAGRQSLEERSGYQDQALQLLRRAVELQAPAERRTFWRKIIAADTALLPIRGSQGYRQLEAETARGGG